MLQVIVFSYNRAMQLDTLLNSLFNNWEKPSIKVDVVYNYSSKEFGDGYELLKERFKSSPLELHKESLSNSSMCLRELLCLENLVRIHRNKRLAHPKTDFRRIVINILKNSPLDNVMFLTDDSMFVKKVNIEDNVFEWINASPTHRQFSLRLGKGVSSLPETVKISGDICEWNLYDNKHNWGYPFSVDAHIYNKPVILNLFNKFLFYNPNTLESLIVGSVIRRHLFEQGRCPLEIKMLTFPINIVQDSIDNVSQNVSVEDLNNRYLNGQILQYSVDAEYNATKQYVKELIFKKINGGGKEKLLLLTQIPQRDKEPNEHDVVITIAGDYSPKERVECLLQKNNWHNAFDGIHRVFFLSDYNIVNFESVIASSQDKRIPKVGSHLKTSFESMFALKSMGTSMITLANNHSMDYGASALARTISEAKQLGINYVGAGDYSSENIGLSYTTIKGIRFAFINACEHEFSVTYNEVFGCNAIDLIETSRLIKEAKLNANYVILIIHGGIEHYQLPSPRMKKWYRFFIDQGADAVINHHQHCFSGFEEYKGKPIFYGLGNLCFDSASDIKYRHKTYNYGYMVRLILDSGKIGYELVPYEQCYKEPIVRLFEKGTEEYESFENKIAELNAVISDDEKLEKSFELNAARKKDYVYGFMRPYSSRIMNSLYYGGLLPSFLTNKRKLIASSIINCESHRDTLIYNLLEDIKLK